MEHPVYREFGYCCCKRPYGGPRGITEVIGSADTPIQGGQALKLSGKERQRGSCIHRWVGEVRVIGHHNFVVVCPGAEDQVRLVPRQGIFEDWVAGKLDWVQMPFDKELLKRQTVDH
jgi:hypothetical protein